MEGKSQNASGSASTPGTAGSSGQATVTISVEAFRMLIQSMNPNTDADLLMAKIRIIPTPPPAVDTRMGEVVKEGVEGPTAEQEEVPEVAREEAEQPLLKPEEVAANLAAGDAEVTEKTMEMGVEIPTERVNVVTDETPEERKVLTAANKVGRIKRATPRDEAARARAATMHIYQRRPAREEASRKKVTEERQKLTPEKEAEGGEKGPARDSFLTKSQKRQKRTFSSR